MYSLKPNLKPSFKLSVLLMIACIHTSISQITQDTSPHDLQDLNAGYKATVTYKRQINEPTLFSWGVPVVEGQYVLVWINSDNFLYVRHGTAGNNGYRAKFCYGCSGQTYGKTPSFWNNGGGVDHTVVVTFDGGSVTVTVNDISLHKSATDTSTSHSINPPSNIPDEIYAWYIGHQNGEAPNSDISSSNIISYSLTNSAGTTTYYTSSSSAGSSGDPHIKFAHGGIADFRGKNNTSYSFLSAPGYHFAATTTDTIFKVPRPQTVDGSFFTDVSWMLRGANTDYGISSSAEAVGFVVYEIDKTESRHLIMNNTRIWTEWVQPGIRVWYKQSTLCVRAHGWEVNTTRKPIYMHISGPRKWRFDITMRKLDSTHFSSSYGTSSKSCFPHGIIGQSWDGDNVGISGKVDDYTFHKENPFVKTVSMAEGSIEGNADDYSVPLFHTEFKFSRYNKQRNDTCAPRNVSALLGQHVENMSTSVASSDDE